MSIASEITRLQGVKSDILTAIGNKGVTVPAGSALDDCPSLIENVPMSDFSLSPNMSVLQLSDQIQYGRVTNTGNTQGVFLIPKFPYDSYNNIERNMKFVINAWNTDGNAYAGDYWTNDVNIRIGACIFYYQDKICVFIASVEFDVITGVNLTIGDEIEENVYIDRVANSLTIKIYKNGSLLVSKTYQNQSILIGTRQFYVLGLRFSPPSGYNSKSTFIFDGSYIKGDGQLLWGLDTSSNYTIIGGKRYKTVVMPDGKEWMAENLDFKFCEIGGTYSTASTNPKGWYINNDESTYGWNGYKCGLLYNWHAVKVLNDNRSELCPGWHVATTTEWDALASAIGTSTAGTKLKALDGSAGTNWPSNWNGTDDYEFKVLPAGGYGGSFFNVGSYAYFWTVTESGSDAYSRAFDTGATMYQDTYYKNYGYSVRLVKDS